MTYDGEPVSFVGRRTRPGHRVRTVVIRPGEALDYVSEEWTDALVVVEEGLLEVECSSGARARFGSGAVLTFAAVQPRRLLNPGATPLILSALTR
ncbi:hypothetical protein N7U49_00310 [Streptomyces sp. AD2-2]|nr:hypothetical protein N7U49_00310 [Streptomyces sp. AD2-2]